MTQATGRQSIPFRSHLPSHQKHSAVGTIFRGLGGQWFEEHRRNRQIERASSIEAYSRRHPIAKSFHEKAGECQGFSLIFLSVSFFFFFFFFQIVPIEPSRLCL